MDKLAAFLSQHLRLAWTAVAVLGLAVALTVFHGDRQLQTGQRLAQLHTEAQRSSIEIMSSTLNGNIMGSITLLGLTDGHIKQEATNRLVSQDANIGATLSILGNAFDVEGVFVVGEDGLIKTSWDRGGSPSTGLDVKFRPYFQMAMKGHSNVYAAVSMARGDRALYFTAPVFAEHAKARSGVGAVVARSNLKRVDALLKGRYDDALLLSPQGVVFASSRPAWLGTLEGRVTPSRIRAIRDLKQFGALFESTDPSPLPVSMEGGVQEIDGRPHAVASAPVRWNDPNGDWRLLVVEDLGRTAPPGDSALKAGIAAGGAVLVGWLCLHLLLGQHARAQATALLQAYVRKQDAHVKYRALVAATSMRLQRCETMDQLAQTFLTDARELLGAVQGAMYAVDSDDTQWLTLIGSAACAEAPPDRLALGEGLLGQCAQDRRTLVVETPSDGMWAVRSGLGHAPPAALWLAPVVVNDTLVGVVELALLVVPDGTLQDQSTELVSVLAHCLDRLRRASPGGQVLTPRTAVRPTEEVGT